MAEIKSMLDAFLTLNEIDDEDVKDMIKPKKMNEGKEFSLLGNKDVDAAREFFDDSRQGEGEVELEVIDADADTLEHLKKKEDYLGQGILSCIKCKTPRFIDMDKLVVSEEDETVYNVDDECPKCGAVGSGYEFVGQVGNANKSEEAPVEEEPMLDNDDKNNNEPLFDNDELIDTPEEETPAEEEAAPEEEISDVVEPDEDAWKDEEEPDGMETSSSEDEDDDLDLPDLGDEVEESFDIDEEGVSDHFKDAVDLDEKLSPLAEEAWMMNRVIESMNNEEAYYGSWLYYWPDGETRADCEEDFKDRDSFEDLKDEFEEIYKEYHGDGLFEAEDDVVEYAHKIDKILDLSPIDNKRRNDVKEAFGTTAVGALTNTMINEADEEVEDEEVEDIIVGDLLASFVDIEDPDLLDGKTITVTKDGVEDPIYDGTFVELPEDVFDMPFVSFNTGKSNLVCNIDMDIEESEQPLKDILEFVYGDAYIMITDVASSETLFEGSKEEAIEKYGDKEFVSFELPEHLNVILVGDDEPGKVEADGEVVEESLFEKICKANGLATYRVDNERSNEYWINESINNKEDLETIYALYVENCDEALINEFKSITGYKTELDIVNEKYNIKPLIRESYTSDELDRFITACSILGYKSIKEASEAMGGLEDQELLVALENAAMNEGKEEPEKDHLVKCDGDGCHCSVDGGETWEECSQEECDELVDGGYKVVEDFMDKELPGDRKKAFNKALAIAKSEGKPVAYGYSDDEGFHAINPLVIRSDKDRDDLNVEFPDAVVYVAYPDKVFVETLNNEPFFEDYQEFDDEEAIIDTPVDEDLIVVVPEGSVDEPECAPCEPECEPECTVCPVCGKEVCECPCEECKESVQHFATRKELTEAIETCKNNNQPFSLKRSTTEGFRYDLITEKLPEESEVLEPVDAELVEPNTEETNLVDPNMSDLEIETLNKIRDVSVTIANAIKKYYDIDADPALIVADIIQDLRLISGAVRPEDLEDTPINNATKEMFNDYNEFYDFVDQISSVLTGESIHTTPEQKFAQALEVLSGPSFSEENIDAGIGSDRFLTAVERGQIPYIPADRIPQLTEALGKETLEESKKHSKYGDEIFPAGNPAANAAAFNHDMGSDVPEGGCEGCCESVDEIDEAKKDEEVDKVLDSMEKVETVIDLVQDEVEAVEGYTDAIESIDDSKIPNKEEIISKLHHIKGEELEHIDELKEVEQLMPTVGELAEEPEKTSEPVEEEPVVEEPVEELPEAPVEAPVEDLPVEESLVEEKLTSVAEIKDEEIIKTLDDMRDAYEPLDNELNFEAWYEDAAGELFGKVLGTDDWSGAMLSSDEDKQLGDLYTRTSSLAKTLVECVKESFTEETPVEESLDESIEFDTDRFDEELNKYFNENYEDTIVYTSEKGSVDDKGVVVLEGVIKSEDAESNVKFTLTPEQPLTEGFKLTDGTDVLKAITYNVSNDLSEEVFKFNFENDTPVEDIFDEEEEVAKDIVHSFVKDCGGVESVRSIPTEELCHAIAEHEFYCNQADYEKNGMDVTHIESLLKAKWDICLEIINK